MLRAILALAVFACALLPHPAIAAESPTQAVGPEVEAAFRDAMAAWSYSEYWRLWAMGLSAQRFALKEGEFDAEMRKGRTRPQGGNAVEAVRVVATSLDAATVHARIGLERGSVTTVVPRTFTLRREDGAWRVNLNDFLNLSRYR